MKKYIALLACLIASSAIGQVITYQARGTIRGLSNAPGFTSGGSYTLDFSINESDLIAPVLGTSSFFSVSSIKFDYEHGTYIGTIGTAEGVAVNLPTWDYFAIGTPFSGGIDFPLVQGNSLLTTIPETNNSSFAILNLNDLKGDAFSSNQFMDLSKISKSSDGGFDDYLALFFASSDPDRLGSAVYGTVDSIERVSQTLSPVPEPSTYGLMGSLALFGLVARRIKRKRQVQAA